MVREKKREKLILDVAKKRVRGQRETVAIQTDVNELNRRRDLWLLDLDTEEYRPAVGYESKKETNGRALIAWSEVLGREAKSIASDLQSTKYTLELAAKL